MRSANTDLPSTTESQHITHLYSALLVPLLRAQVPRFYALLYRLTDLLSDFSIFSGLLIFWATLKRVDKKWEAVTRIGKRVKDLTRGAKTVENKRTSSQNSWEDVRLRCSSCEQHLSFTAIVCHSLLLETSAIPLARVLLVRSFYDDLLAFS